MGMRTFAVGLVRALGVAGLVAAGSVGPASAAPAARADLRVDVNRDGVVDVVSRSDDVGERRWSTARGAVVLPNLDDDTQRCSRDESQSDEELAACHDAADKIVNGPEDVRDLAPMRVVARPDVPSDASGTVEAIGAGAKLARIFVNRGGTWSRLGKTESLTASQLGAGVELGVEATDIVRDRAVWDGDIDIRLTVTTGARSTRDVVTLHVAPVLTHHPLQAAQQVLVTDNAYPVQQQFIEDLEAHVSAAGISAPLITIEDNDIWTQDFFEPAYASMTGPDGAPHVMRIMIRSAQDRWAGRQVFTRLRGPDVAAVQMTGPQGWDSLDSFGNLETIPPYTLAGTSYPAGRIIQGQRSDSHRPSSQMRTMLRSQGMQDPLLLDTSWLYVGHVDEFVQFLPADTARGWKIGIADPALGLDLLRDAQRSGHGAKRLISLPGGPAQTIDQALADRQFLADNALATDRIEANLIELQDATGATDSEIVRIPALYSREWPGGPLQRLGYRPPLQNPSAVEQASDGGTVETAAHIPGAVNGMILSREYYLAPQQWGPVIDGVDIFGAAVQAAYAEVGMGVAFIDNWYSHHVGLGEVHCGTNIYRDGSAPWWPSTG